MFRQIVKLFIFWKITLLVFAFLATFLLHFNPHPGFTLEYLQNSPSILGVWANFDGTNYLNIVKGGYGYPLFAFFPLLPFLTFLAHRLTSLPILEAGLLITNLAFFLSLFVFHKIILLDFEQKIAWRSLIFLLAFPVSFFYGAVYTESLFFLLATLSFYFARNQRWFWAGFFGFLASLSRLVGVTLLPVLLFEWFWQNREKVRKLRDWLGYFVRQRVFFIFLVPLGIISYGLYLQLTFADFFLFQKAMSHWGQGNFVLPLQVLFRYLKILFLAPWNLAYFVAILELVSAFFYFFLAFYVFKKVRISYGLWMLVSLLIPTFTGTLQSMPRYILHLFPAFIALALLTSSSKKAFWVTVAVCLLLQFILVALFTRGYFVA